MFKKSLFALSAVLVLAACNDEGNGNGEETAVDDDTESEVEVIRVAAQTPPMTDVVEIVQDVIEEPYEVELIEVSDNIQYNEALLNEEVDANFAQHEPFMEMFNEERDGNLVALQPMYNAIVGFYSQEYESIDDVEDGIEIAIPSDATNEARALLILNSYGLIELDEEVGFNASVEDIVDNPRNFEFTHVDLLNLNSSYEDGIELVFNYPTYIANLDLTPEDAVFLEDDEDNVFGIQLVAREDNEDSDAIQALLRAFKSQEVYDFLKELEENGHLEVAFEVE